MKNWNFKSLLYFSFWAGLCFCFLAEVSFAGTSMTEGTSQTYWDRSKEGWFWYHDPPPPEEEAEEAEPPPPKTFKDFKEAEVWDMAPPQFQEIYDNTLNAAVQKPTEESVKDWYTMQDIGRRKALEFTHVSQYVVQTNPDLNFLKDSPLAAPGRKALYQQQKKDVQNALAQARQENGLIYFYSTTCPYCVEQSKILKRFTNQYGWEIRGVNILDEPELASHFNVETTPTILLVDRDNPNSFPVGVGVVARSELEQNIYRGMRILNGTSTPSQYNMYDFQIGSALDPMATRPINQGNQ